MSKQLFTKTMLLLLGALLILAACTNSRDKPNSTSEKSSDAEPILKLGTPQKIKNDGSVQIYPTEFAYLAGWNKENHAAAFSSFQRSCQSWQAQPDNKILGGVFELGRIGDWKRLCGQVVQQGEEKQFFEKWFQPFAVADNSGFEGLFTGYYLPELRGSYKKTVRYHVPIYGVPNDLLKRDGKTGRLENGRFVPYYNRAEIAAGALEGKNLEILWVEDEVDAYFMEVQGSGRVVMEDGRVQGVGYAGKNGRTYYAIGKWLSDNGAIPKEEISMQTIRAWIDKHPEEGRQLMLKNPSVVFFRLTESKSAEGPIGTMGAPLTPGYSLAVDRSYLPLGVPLWLDLEPPAGADRLRRLVMAQDTGSAIKGLIRGDVYWGHGQQAGEIAGGMKAKGRYFLLIPRKFALG